MKLCGEYVIITLLNLKDREVDYLKLIADTHSHTLVSGHAYNTIREMVQAAASKGIKLFAITEHAPEMPGTCAQIYFENLNIIPREMEGIQVLFGAEVNILDEEGNIDLYPELCERLDIVIASIHGPCFHAEHTKEAVTQAYLNVMEKPYINVIGHPDDARFPVDAESLVKKAKETNTLIEVNNSSLTPGGFRIDTHGTMLNILKLCKQYQVPVTTSSDAHVDVDAGNLTYVYQILEECEFPEELVVTTESEKIKPYLNKYKK